MNNENLYQIGEFSNITQIPVRTLRYYDEEKVLVPDFVDQFSNYRYYSENNRAEAEVIKFMKATDFSLDNIKNYKNNLSEEVIENQILNLVAQRDELNTKIVYLEQFKNELHERVKSNDNQKRLLLKKDA